MMRFEGKLKEWNYERGFGAIASSQGGDDLFILAAAFPPGGDPPQLGEALSFEVEVDTKGRKKVLRVQRLPRRAKPELSPAAEAFQSPAPRRSRSSPRAGRRWSFWLMVACVSVVSAAAAGTWLASLRPSDNMGKMGSQNYVGASKQIKAGKSP